MITASLQGREALKQAWLRLPYVRRLEYAVTLPKLGRWASERLHAVPEFDTREDLLEAVSRAAGSPSLYLEFGVAAGHSLGRWLAADTDPRSQMIGLDTFTGLPEAWSSWRVSPKGEFDTGGVPPESDDLRVSFRTGLFQETLPTLLTELPDLLSGRSLVIHMDADLYSSTLYALTQLDPFLPGAIVLFDEWANPLHEFRALHDYCNAYRRDYDVIATWRGFRKIALRIKAHATT